MSFALNNRRTGFTLVEIMIVVAIIALLAIIAIPNFVRARKRSQATTILNELRLIDFAKGQYSADHNQAGTTPTAANLQIYFKDGSRLYNAAGAGSVTDIFGNLYVIGTYNALPRVNSTTKASLADAVDDGFWSPYQ